MNFALLLFVLLVVCFAVWLLDRLFFRHLRQEGQPEPWWIEYPKSFLPVILAVFVLRSFLFEPFRIPSGSMIPTLLVGDFILVNKFAYGIRLPIINRKVIDVADPQRGDVMVFRYPEDTRVDYIKRIVGVPGDVVTYRDKRLTINGQDVPMREKGEYLDIDAGADFVASQRYASQTGDHAHDILVRLQQPTILLSQVRQFEFFGQCKYRHDGFECKVPADHYFMMGDNRDASSDSRYWGFVPDENIVGKAFMIWWNFGRFDRIGRAVD